MCCCRVSSSIFSADARFVLSGSDDGNVRIWKARASDKLGIVTARERAAMEYRDSLKERWKMDAQVGKVSRCVPVSLPGPTRFSLVYARNSNRYIFSLPETDIYPNLSIRLQNSSGRCWKHGESRKSGGGNIHGLGRRNRRQRGRAWSSWNKHSRRLFSFFRFEQDRDLLGHCMPFI